MNECLSCCDNSLWLLQVMVLGISVVNDSRPLKRTRIHVPVTVAGEWEVVGGLQIAASVS